MEKEEKHFIETMKKQSHDIHLERRVLRTMLKSSILAKKACDVLREETFYLRKNQTVFSAIKRLVESHKPITGETLLETLGQDMDRREIKSYISYLMDEEWLGMGELQVSCHILIKKRIQRILLELGESCLEDLHE